MKKDIQGDKKSSIGITVDTPIETLEKTEWNVKVTDDTWVWEQKLELPRRRNCFIWKVLLRTAL